jgi:small conductance mechanosensitive channel
LSAVSLLLRRLLLLLAAVALVICTSPHRARANTGFPLIDAARITEPAATSPRSRSEVLEAGSYELAKVRILGVPALTVASPVLRDGDALGAKRRASVIEGNLRLLYDPNRLCSQSERLSEWMLESLLGQQAKVCTSGPGDGVTLSHDPLTVSIQTDAAGNQILEAQLPDRQRQIPLMTVTRADAEINGVSSEELARRWKILLERRINHARRILTPERLLQRWRLTLVVELLLFGVLAGLIWCWAWIRRRRCLLQHQRQQGVRNRRLELHLHLLHTITRVLMVLVLFLLVVMVGLGVMALPGRVPLGIELLLQPSFAILKVGVVTVLGLLGRALCTFLLHQWADNVDVMEQERARRDQRYRSLLRVSHRLVDVACVLVVGVWIVVDIPGVRSASTSILVAGGALLGALAFVFQSLLRDFVAGMLVLLEDRYAIGDWVEIGGVEGEVIDVGLFSTDMRCLDQRVDTLENSAIRQLRNHTKLRSGSLIKLLISHRQSSIDQAIGLIGDEIERFVADPNWGERLLSQPILRGVRRITPLGTQLEVLLITRAGEQWVTEREFQLRVLRSFEQHGVVMADGLELNALT